MEQKSSKALTMLLNYESDSDKDSGYTSEEEKKRKSNFPYPEEKLKRKKVCDEGMIVDGECFSWHSDSPITSEDSQAKNTLDDVSTKRNLKRGLSYSEYLHSPTSQPKRMIPLPKELNASPSHTDDPAVHQGRIRSFPHERGNWASLIYIPLTFGVFYLHLNSLVTLLITSCKEKDMKVLRCSDYHISLTQTFILRLEWIQPLIEDLKKSLFKIKRFSLWVHGLVIYANLEKTRTFLALKVIHGKAELEEAAGIANESLKKYKLSSLYEDCSFHVSIAWCHGNKSDELKKLLPLLQNVCDHYFNTESDMRALDVTEIHVKTGNRIHSIPLIHT